MKIECLDVGFRERFWQFELGIEYRLKKR